jgi:glycosyltransferase involved in cell wall biosynthesis
MRILVGSDSPNVPSGFAQQLKGVAQYLASEGHEVWYLGWQTRHDYKSDEWDFKILGVTSQFGKQDWDNAFRKCQPEVLITLGDAHMVDVLARQPKRPLWMMYYPLDGHPISKYIAGTIQGADIPIAMANYSWQLTKDELGFEPQYIPHFYKPEEFYDLGDEMREEIRTKLGIPENAFVIGSIARLNPRKHHQRLLYGFRLFLDSLPLEERKDVYLYLHFDPQDPLMYQDPNHNYQFLELMDTMMLTENILMTPGNTYHSGLPPSYVNDLYNAFDCHVISTGGEGFGVPFIEAAATGIPTIATDYSTTKEHIYMRNPYTDKLVKDFKNLRGLAVPYSRLYMELAQVQKAWINVEKLAESFAIYYNDRDLMKRHGKNAKEYVEKYYQYDTLMEKWAELFDKVFTNLELAPLRTEMQQIR